VWKARLRATAQLVKRTRSLGLLECDVTDEGGSLVARVYSSCMVLRGEDARGR
jgi:acyl-coenzyme A thioesterase PaaI-like protein